MRVQWFVVAVGVLLGADAAKDDQAALQGTWDVVSRRLGGQDDPNVKGFVMTFAMDTAIINKGKVVMMKGKFKLDPARSPKHIDVTYESKSKRLDGQTSTSDGPNVSHLFRIQPHGLRGRDRHFEALK